MSIIIHEGSSFLVSDELGDVTPGQGGGFFHLDTRFLSEHTLRMGGERLILLQAWTPRAHEAFHHLTNPELEGVPASTLAVLVHRELGGGGLRESIEVKNFTRAVRVEFQLSLACDFEYILTVKAGGGSRPGARRVRSSVRQGRTVEFALDEEGSVHRALVEFEPRPERLETEKARFTVALEPHARWCATLKLSPEIEGRRGRAAPPSRSRVEQMEGRQRDLRCAWPSLSSDHPVLGPALAQASRDLAALRIKAEGETGEEGGGGRYAIAAGIPWYMDLFGRDSLIASYASMLHDPALARGTLDALARLQGRNLNPVSEEEPWKILHEYRRGPLTPAARHVIPAYPYYGTIDATPLFLVTLSEYVRVTGDLGYADAQWEVVRAAVDWMRRYGDRDGDGLLEYQRHSGSGLINQGWKDSTDSVRFRDGRVAAPPIALVEVQGYAYDARRRVAELARRLNRGGEADRLEDEAAALRGAIHERYWLDERRYYAEALDGEKRPVDALTSNPGHLLWSGAVSQEGARAIARVLLSGEMFSGFGVRTMGSGEGGFNPVSYHDGSVWPHDNALILAGLVRYGLREEATRLASGLLAALNAFPHFQPPELFCGFARSEFDKPIRYPTACRPQAWASGAVVLLVRSTLGLVVDGLRQKIVLAPLALPEMSRLSLEGVPAGAARFDVEVRVRDGKASAEVTRLPAGWSLEHGGISEGTEDDR